MAIDLARVGRTHVALLAAASLVAVMTSWLDPASLVVGGAVMGANLWLLYVITRTIAGAVENPERSGRLVLAVGAFVLKLGLFLALIWLLLQRLAIDEASFVVGVTLLLVACVLEAAVKGK